MRKYTYRFEGSQEKPGLAVRAISEILSKAMEFEMSVSVSLYEVIQDHAYDLLDPKHLEVQILEAAHGKIHLKGLSQVSVKSIQEFHNIYFSRGSFQKSAQKIPTEQTRNHKGLMIRVTPEDDNLKTMLTSYEDSRRNIKDGIIFNESNRTKSLYTLLNVVYAVNADEKHEQTNSNITRISCRNESCNDAYMLVSLSRRNAKQVLIGSTNRSRNSAAKVKAPSSRKSGKTPYTSLIMEKQIASSVLMSRKKDSSILRGRKLFDGEKSNNSKQHVDIVLRCPPEDTSARKSMLLPLVASDDKYISDVNSAVEPKENVRIIDSEIYYRFKEFTLNQRFFTHSRSDNVVVSPGRLGEENVPLKKNEDGVPSLTQRLREISNNLRSLCSSIPSRVKFLDNAVTPYSSQIDPKTPVMELPVKRYRSPRGTFSSRSSGVKHSLVQKYLNFLNSANKANQSGYELTHAPSSYQVADIEGRAERPEGMFISLMFLIRHFLRLDEVVSHDVLIIQGIGEKRATYILELREETPKPFKQLDDLQDIGLSAKQIKGMLKQVAGELFN
ncbi:kinesin-like protein KIN-10C [Olea europaea var. sylvestris]|uniref:kinesin-like protein KIN-10C n=1 Tax=Olea europaea var. sylvestris TaxID=158386 RepID=UPI000C1D8A27|nr:kinesin-like protein KIN-10C [Olea europaea var. sylvestris]